MNASRRLARHPSVGAIALAIAGIACAWSLPPAHGAEAGLARVAPVFLTLSAETNLENAFWACDYHFATHGGDKVDATACSAIYEALKERKFGGSFEALIEWWRQNKAVEHARMQRIETQAVAATPTL